jgi:serine/threonine-protein kinase
MSVVWRATDEVLDRTVAVKVLNSAQARDARAIVLAEAQAAARVAHPNVASVFDYGESVSPDGTTVPYVVMELVAGTSLAQRLDAGPLEPRSAMWVATEIAAGLAAAHEVGLVHRDVKPGNVILSPAGTKMVDFGIAAVAGEPDGPDGRVMGTRLYLPPERLSRGVAVPASDMYAWGVLLHAMLTGRPPWPDDATPAQRAEHVRGVPPLPGVPAEVDGVFRRCLEPDPSARPTAREAALVVGAAAGIPFALPDVPGPVGVATNDPTVQLRPRPAVHLGPLVPAAGATGQAGAATMIDAYPIAPPARWRRARVVVGATVVAVITLVVLAGILARSGPGTSDDGRLEAPASAAPTQPGTTAPAADVPARVTLTSAGGSVVASCDGATVRVHQATPAAGFDLHNGIPGPGSDVEVRFRNGSADVRMIIRCTNGTPVYSLKR